MRLNKIVLAVIALCAIACSPEGGGNSSANTTKWESEGSVIGEWELTSFSDSNEARPRVYLELKENGEFEMYQQAFSMKWEHFKGTFTYNGTTMSGKYSDEKPWSTEYAVSFAEEPTRLRLINTANDKEVSIYNECEIPDSVIDEAREPESVRSATVKRFL